MVKMMVARSQDRGPFRLLLLLAVVLGLCVPGWAQAKETDNKVVRVGWYESAFHTTDEFGRRSGYGYEYQMRVATYTGWSYEYVEGSWSELFEMLVNGDIDILSDVSYTPERAETILYSSEPMGSEDYHVFIAPDNTEISPDDFSTFDGKRVGVNKNSIQEQLFIDWCEKHDVHPEICELTVKTPELLDMLAAGDIDMLVTLDTYGNSADMVPVCKIGYAESFFGINKRRPDLKRELDVAMNRILESNRDFNLQMTERFNRASTINRFLSEDERGWLKDNWSIKLGFRDGFLPFSGTDEETGVLVGSLADFVETAADAERNATLSFQPSAYASTDEALDALVAGEVDCVFPVHLSAYDGEQMGVIITDPLVSTEMYAVVPKSDHQGISPDNPMKVALVKGEPSYVSFLKDNFPSWTFAFYDDFSQCMEAVAEGRADCCLVCNYRISRIASQLQELGLVTLSTGTTMNMGFACARDNDRLYSILNKVIRYIPETAVNASLTNYGVVDEKVSFVEFLRDNLPSFIAVVATITVAILVLVLRNMRSDAKVKEGCQIISEAERDALTNLYNWNFFLVYANRIHREHPEDHMDAIVINIDSFHAINAQHGRDFGDNVLRELGAMIQGHVDDFGGIASRYESDRFDIFCPHRDDWQHLLDSLQTHMDETFHNANIHLRMGVCPWRAGVEPVEQFDCARTACNLNRGGFTGQVTVYDKAMRQREERDQLLLNDMPRALAEHEFIVYYQPKYDIQTSEPTLSSAEALVRWRHPVLGMISPGEFIPLLERNGQISELDRYVWEQAASQVADWRDRLDVLLPVSVNLSRVDVFDPQLISTLEQLVKSNGLSCHDLKLEVTESAYTENAEMLIEVIKRLRKEGFEIEMDDFGSGYSSLNMLSSMPVDILKMDMAFIRNIERDERDFRLVELIVDIARYLDVPVIAEGVETAEQLRLLKDTGCDIVQGYYFSRPLPADEFELTVLRR